MFFIRCAAVLAGLLPLLSAQAQTTPTTPPVPGFSSRGVAHDSLQSQAARIRAQALARAAGFESSQGNFGGPHRRTKTYAGVPQGVVNAIGFKTTSPLVERQVIRHRYGMELEKRVYYDPKGHVILTEQFENQQLVRLLMTHYDAAMNLPVAEWLLVRGDYLRYTTAAVSLAYRSDRRTQYFFRPRPTPTTTGGL